MKLLISLSQRLARLYAIVVGTNVRQAGACQCTGDGDLLGERLDEPKLVVVELVFDVFFALFSILALFLFSPSLPKNLCRCPYFPMAELPTSIYEW